MQICVKKGPRTLLTAYCATFFAFFLSLLFPERPKFYFFLNSVRNFFNSETNKMHEDTSNVSLFSSIWADSSVKRYIIV